MSRRNTEENTEVTETVEVEKPAFDVSATDKRNDKRVLVDYVFAQRYNPELLAYFAPYEAQLDEALATIEATEGATAVTTPVDTQIAQLSEKLVHRYENEYSDYALKGAENAASFFLPKAGRSTKSPV